MGLTNGELRAAIERELNTQSVVPEGKKGAVIAHLDGSGVRVVSAFKAGEHWEVQDEVGWNPHSSGLNWGVNVVGSW